MLATQLRNIRLEHQLTQKELADVLGIDRTTYTYYETGVTSPSPATLYKLSQIYRVTVGYLMGVEENHPERLRAPGSLLSAASIDPLAELPPDERKLLMSFRVLAPEEKDAAMQQVGDLVRRHESLV